MDSDINQASQRQINGVKGRDADYRIAALKCAIARAGQDGGIEGGIDVLALGEIYYQWLRGAKVSEKPALEKQ